MDSSQEKLANIISKLKNNCLSVSTKVAANYGCPKIFDRFYCWPETKPGVLAEQLCSNDFLIATNKTQLVTKQCTENGTWYMKKGSERPWTNFSQCGNIHYIDVEATRLNNETSQMCGGWLTLIKDTTNVGYGLSIVALFFALVIFIKLKRLHCERNKLHVNLFTTYVLRALIYFAKNAFFFEGPTLVNDVRHVGGQPGPDYAWMCKLFTSIQFYVTTCNFTFMLMEGLYLHNLIFLNLFSESHGTTIYCVLGWAIPVLFIVPWIVLKILFENVYCWTKIENEYILLFLEVPTGITVIVNFVLFTIIMRVLIMKLHFTSTFTNHKHTKCRKLLKSTLILIPLYGIPYTISLALRFFLHVQRSNSLEMIWMFFDQTFTSFQGLFAALVYCLLNGEVQKEVFRKYNSLVDQSDKEFRRSRTLSTNTQNVSLPNDDAVENLKLVGIIDEETANLHLANSGT